MPPIVWRGLTQKLSSSMAEHKWKNTELYHTYLCPPYFSNCWELRSAGEQTIVHWWHTVCHPSMISILEAARPAQSASMKGENHAVSFCSPDLPQPPPFQDPRQHLNSWQIFFVAVVLLGVFLVVLERSFCRSSLIFPMRFLVLACLEGTQQNVTWVSCTSGSLVPCGQPACSTGSWLQPCLIWLIS